MKIREKLGIFQGITSLLLVSLSFVISKILLESTSPETLVLMREIISVVIVLMLFGFAPELKKIVKFKTKTNIALVIFSLLSGAIAPFLFLKGLAITAATDTILINSMDGIVTGIMASIFLKDKISFEKVIGIIFMFSGVAVISTNGFTNGLTISAGYLFIIGAVFATSAGTIIFKKFLSHLSTDIVVLSRNFWGIVSLLLVFPFIFDVNYEIASMIENKQTLMLLLVYAIFILLTAQFLWYKSLEKIKTSVTSLLILLKPLFGVIFAVLILKEDFGSFHLVGGILIIMGLLFSMIHRKKHGKITDNSQKKHHFLPHWLHF